MGTCGPNSVEPNTLAAFKNNLLQLQSSEFFQDSHLVKVLCGVLGERLFSPCLLYTSDAADE